MNFLNSYRIFKNNLKGYQPNYHLLRLEINSQQLKNNIHFIKTKFNIPYLTAVLKSNAYGHGLKEIGKILDSNSQIFYLAVDNIIEAKILRNFNIKKPIIILGYVPQNILKDLKRIKNIILVVNSLTQAEILSQKINFPLTVHIKIDTGLHRQGISLKELITTIEILKRNPYLKIQGLMSHLAEPTNNKNLSIKQLECWKEGVAIYKRMIPDYQSHFFHLLATAGINYFSQIENNLARIGIGIYGFDTTTEKNLSVKPVLSLFAKIVNIKTVKKGEGVGYGFSWIANKDTKIAVIPCGYYEGVPRYLSNVGYFYYQDKPLKIIGRVSMNLTIIDISEINNLQLEDEVEVFSTDPQKLNSFNNVADIGKTIPYEVLVHLSPQIKRVVK